MTTSDNISAIEAIEKAMEGVTPGPWDHTECDDGARMVHTIGDIIVASTTLKERDAAYIAACNPVAMSAILAEARKAGAMEREIADLRKLLAGDHEVKPLSEERLDEILEFEEQFKMLGGAGDTASLDWATQRALIDEAVLACRARTLLNGGSDAQE